MKGYSGPPPGSTIPTSFHGSIALGVLLFGTMLIGIVAGQLFQEVSSRANERVRLGALLGTLNRGRAWAAMLVSPIVFFSTLSSLLGLGPSPIAFFYAFQNGFFCLAIFNGISAKLPVAQPQKRGSRRQAGPGAA
jgi:hypothetical protein